MKKQTTTWGGHRPNAGRKPGTIKLTPDEIWQLLQLNISPELSAKLVTFLNRGKKAEETK